MRIYILLTAFCYAAALFGQNEPQRFPFSYDSFLIIAEGIINDSIKAKFCLDTGATDISLSEELVEKYAINKKELEYSPFFGGGAGNDSAKVKVAFEKINYKIANETLTNSIYKVYKNLSEDVLVGIEPKDLFTFEIYYDKKEFRLYKGQAKMDFDKSWTRIKYKNHLTKITIPLKVKIGKKTISGDFLLDTGSGHAILFTGKTAEKYKLNQMNVRKWKAELGLSGKSEGGTIQSESIQLGENKFDNVDIHYFNDQQGALSDGYFYIGVLGNRVLEKFDVIIDYVKEYVYIRPNSLYNTPIITTSNRLNYE
ncbi:pepsin/retropepsin-like aspartic protease family protein [Bacteroides sp. 519]|uniref:pepsin/retropepsin-like aspartic protease family protein n=1 Tax=Bacteroides sp. 519 TaxID=2302937 RepID=UPI0013D89703|nr:pepsin/retropepsin-like aspartic protease family protein [Bacteroides sp. 519]NDV57251.1 hypothetical protein [Bacteroides sp. 519]